MLRGWKLYIWDYVSLISNSIRQEHWVPDSQKENICNGW